MRGFSEYTPSIDVLVEHLRAAFTSLHCAGVRSRDTYSRILRESLLANSCLLSTWTVWEPDALDGQDKMYANTEGHDMTGRFVTCWHRVCKEIERVPVVGYLSPSEGDWYWMPKRRMTSCQLAPIDYRLGSHPVRITSRISPVVIDGKFHGAVGVDLPAPDEKPEARQDTFHQRQSGPTSASLDSKLSILSPRQREVLHWLSQGKSNDDIAIILGISPHTVKNHVDHIFQKLGIHNRYEAMLAAA